MKKGIFLIIMLGSFCLGYLVCLIPTLRSRDYIERPMASEVNWSFLTPGEAEKLTDKINSVIQDKQAHVRCIVAPSAIGGPKLYFYNTFGMRRVTDEVMKLAMDVCEKDADTSNEEAQKSGQITKMFK